MTTAATDTFWHRHLEMFTIVNFASTSLLTVLLIAVTVFFQLRIDSLNASNDKLTHEVDLNLLYVTSDYDPNKGKATYTLVVEIQNAGQGTARDVTFGVGPQRGDPADRTLGARDSTDDVKGTVLVPATVVPKGLVLSNGTALVPSDPAKIVTVWVEYMDGLGNPFTVEFSPKFQHKVVLDRFAEVPAVPCDATYCTPTPLS